MAITTINRRLNSLRSFYSWAQKNRKLQYNPMEEIYDLKFADEAHEELPVTAIFQLRQGI